MTPQTPSSLLLITGPVGVGKSAVADEVFELLRKTPVRVALVNFDELTYVSPRPDNDKYGTRVGLKSLAAIWENYRQIGARNLTIPYVFETQEGIDRFATAVPDCRVTTVRLTADINTLKDRLSQRPMGGDLEWHLQRSEELSNHYATSDIGDAIINTEDKTIREVAEEVIDCWRENGLR